MIYLPFSPSRPEDEPLPSAPAVMRVYADPKLPELTLLECLDCAGHGYTGDEYTGKGCDTCDRTGQLEVCSGCKQVPTVDMRGLERCGCSQDEPTLEPLLECALCHRWVLEAELAGGACCNCRGASLDPEVVWALSQTSWLTAGETGLS